MPMGTSAPRPTAPADRRILALLAACAVGATLGGCGVSRDLGPPARQERVVDGASAVDLRTSGDLTIRTGDGPSLTVTAGANVIDDLTSDVRDGVLVLGSDGPRLWGHGDVRYELQLPSLEGIRVSGSGDVDVDRVDSQRLDLVVSGSGSVTAEEVAVTDVAADISGSGSIALTGSADQQDVRISGSGSYSADGLTTNDARVVISGSGNATVHAGETLTAEVSGSGTVTYAGDPQVTSRVSGSGSVGEG